ncbi:cilia- and flagella-associated protein 36-like [Gigantopelta aegis]|uniref:cilia- and flagella-associated protein 36-like n=1 Tax=Gigantopelta aegis TaxID=1735272 RepID=UPI001B88CE40|nr:cilia- and flagella-associated protein 36-like [Gigantopelta aegis]
MGSRTNERYVNQLIQFLKSYYFQYPIKKFMDKYCTEFDATDMENPEYVKLHEEYRMLIDTLLDAFEDEFGLMDGQLIEAVRDMNTRVTDADVGKDLYWLIRGADDLALFTAMMISRNVVFRGHALTLLAKYKKKLPSKILPEQPCFMDAMSTKQEDIINNFLDVIKKENAYIHEDENPDSQVERSNNLKQMHKKMLIMNSKERVEGLTETLSQLYWPRTKKAVEATLDVHWVPIANNKEPPKDRLRNAIAKRLQTEVLFRTP